MRLSSTTPGVQVYFGNYLNGVKGKGGAIYKQRGALCLETQSNPDAIQPDAEKHPEFCKGHVFIMRPGGKPYTHDMVMKFEISA